MPTCPHCELSIDNDPYWITWHFGRRGSYVQAWCRACRGGACQQDSPCAPCQREAIYRRARRLCGVSLQGVADYLSFNETDKGRYGRAVERLLGLPAGHNRTGPDWHGVEVKAIALDGMGQWGITPKQAREKIFVSAESQDPIAKLQHVLFIFFDYDSKVVCSTGRMKLTPILRRRLEADIRKRGPRSGADLLFLNTKGSGTAKTYAWYLCREFFQRCGLSG